MANRFEKLYIQCGKIDWQIILKNYIYNVAKNKGKSSEIHTNNYRQL